MHVRPGEIIDAQPITPARELIAWLEANAERNNVRTRFRIPISITRKGLGLDAAIAGLEIQIDDTALGISLSDRLGDEAGAQTRWLEGTWGPLVGPGDTSTNTFAVLDVGEELTGDEALEATIVA